MQRLEVRGAVRLIYRSLGVKWLTQTYVVQTANCHVCTTLLQTHIIKGDSLARGPKLVSIKNYVNQLTDDDRTTGYFQQDGATCHTSNASMREIESFFKTELSQKIFGHPDLPI